MSRARVDTLGLGCLPTWSFSSALHEVASASGGCIVEDVDVVVIERYTQKYAHVCLLVSYLSPPGSEWVDRIRRARCHSPSMPGFSRKIRETNSSRLLSIQDAGICKVR